jgi:isopenicillin N synthase-like dioxygenase
MARVEYLPNSKVIVLDYNELIKDVDYSSSIEEAFGFNGLGILAVKNVPNLSKLREDILPLAHKFANLPDEIKNKTEHKESFYSFGWSYGKEMMSEGKPDYSKGSYYANPVYNQPFDDEELIKKYPAFAHPNIWPREDLPELEHAFLAMGNLVVNVGLLVSRQCDRFVNSKQPNYPAFKMHDILQKSKTAKARLLHYFPLETELSEEDMNSWCGWHNDHGSLTGLVPAMFINKQGVQVPNPDQKAGLYIRSRSGETIKANVPSDCLAFQIGETAQIHSGGLLQATPHAVRGAQGPDAAGVSRETMAVFMEPMWDEPMNIPNGSSVDDITKGSSAKFLPPGVPLLEKRWKPDIDFGGFTDITLKSYYT